MDDEDEFDPKVLDDEDELADEDTEGEIPDGFHEVGGAEPETDF